MSGPYPSEPSAGQVIEILVPHQEDMVKAERWVNLGHAPTPSRRWPEDSDTLPERWRRVTGPAQQMNWPNLMFRAQGRFDLLYVVPEPISPGADALCQQLDALEIQPHEVRAVLAALRGES